jgi:2-methylisocitrate lyase-like PEP mutase family enzyme
MPRPLAFVQSITVGHVRQPRQSNSRFDDAVARVNFLHRRNDLDDTIRRLAAFAEAGADVLYAPYPPDMDAVEAIVRAVAPKPVNVVVGTKSGTPTVAELSQAGVKRINTGAALYTHLATALLAAATALSNGDLAVATAGMSLRDVDALIGDAQGS